VNRIAAHPTLRSDPDFRQFLEAEGVSIPNITFNEG